MKRNEILFHSCFSVLVFIFGSVSLSYGLLENSQNDSLFISDRQVVKKHSSSSINWICEALKRVRNFVDKKNFSWKSFVVLPDDRRQDRRHKEELYSNIDPSRRFVAETKAFLWLRLKRSENFCKILFRRKFSIGEKFS